MSAQIEQAEQTDNEQVKASLLRAEPANSNGHTSTSGAASTWGRAAAQKYRAFAPVPLRDRTWPDKVLDRAPLWCSVDLRDGNQALAIPMSVEEKLEMFALLCDIGFTQIEIGFPSASQTEFDFCRRLIDEKRIPDGVSVQVLVQCREELIRRTFEALEGVPSAIVHIYNSTNPAQRRIVFNASREQVQAIAVRGAELVKELADARPETQWALEYSPESFVLTELDFSLQVCEAVCDVWQPTPDNKIILNLPTTVESSTPNVHADQIEWFCRHLKNRDSAIISLHTHNDRGTGVAATELALLAGADRVEGTLFGNGERTGNLDIVTVALNLYSQGVDPGLDLSNLPHVREIYERTTRMEVPPRHPYAGDLVFTAFSGSHQDAISKGFTAQDPNAKWEVPYLPVDPKDIGRDYKKIVRYNSQSGKGGAAFLLEQDFGFSLPRMMKVEFGQLVQQVADEKGGELGAPEIFEIFQREYLQRESPIQLLSFDTESRGNGQVLGRAQVLASGVERTLEAVGNGPIDAFVIALRKAEVLSFDVLNFAEHSLEGGAEARAVAYVQIAQQDASTFYGAAIDTNTELAGVKAVVSALNRALSA
jgi:2-isopropylmalate synthase